MTCEHNFHCPECPPKYAMFEGPLLCVWDKNLDCWGEPKGEPGWYVINGEWPLTTYFKEIGRELPKMVWSGHSLPVPNRGYQENINAINEMLRQENGPDRS